MNFGGVALSVETVIYRVSCRFFSIHRYMECHFASFLDIVYRVWSGFYKRAKCFCRALLQKHPDGLLCAHIVCYDMWPHLVTICGHLSLRYVSTYRKRYCVYICVSKSRLLRYWYWVVLGGKLSCVHISFIVSTYHLMCPHMVYCVHISFIVCTYRLLCPRIVYCVHISFIVCTYRLLPNID